MNYKTKRELIERKEESVAKLLEFLREENDYQSIMTEMAIAQTTIMELMDTAQAHGHDRKMVEVTIFSIYRPMSVVSPARPFRLCQNREKR